MYTLIEVAGMAVAIAFVLYIGTFLIGQFTSDSFIKKKGDIYVGQSERMYLISGTAKEQVEGKFPEVEDICRVMGTFYFAGPTFEMRGGLDDVSERQNALIADANFFEFCPFPLVEGEHSRVLAAENSILLSESCAARLFPGRSPVGESIRIVVNSTPADLLVTGVFEDFRNTVFHAPDIIYRTDVLQDLFPDAIKNGNGICAVLYRIADGADTEALAAEIEKILKENDYIYAQNVFKEFRLTPFKDIATNSLNASVPFEGVIAKDFISIFIAAGALLLFFAVLNYISLTVAQTGFRAKEMASRRLLGAQRSGIILRYIAESFLLTAVSFAAGLLLAWAFSPQFSELVGKEVNPLEHIGLAESAFMVTIVLLLSVCSGIIPAMLVSKYKPIDVVRGNFARTSKMTVGKVLVAVQSTVAVVCIAVAMIMLLQLRHMVSKPMGYERDGRIMVANANKPSEYCVDELKSLAGVERVGWTQHPPMSLSTNGRGFRRNGEMLRIDAYFGDQEAFEILGFKVIRQNAEPVAYSMWLPESVMTALGLNYDCTALDLDDGNYIPVCGIIEDFHRGNADQSGMTTDFLTIPWILEMDSEEAFMNLQGLVVQVSGDENEAAERIRRFYAEKGFSDDDIVVKTYNVLNSELYMIENRNVALISVFSLLVVLLASLAMLAMSAYYSKQNANSAAVRKVMGCTRGQLYLQTVLGFLKSVGFAVMVACPVAYLAAGRWLESYSYRIDNHLWVYLLAALAMALVALLSVTWQTIRLMNTSPIKVLAKE